MYELMLGEYGFYSVDTKSPIELKSIDAPLAVNPQDTQMMKHLQNVEYLGNLLFGNGFIKHFSATKMLKSNNNTFNYKLNLELPTGIEKDGILNNILNFFNMALDKYKGIGGQVERYGEKYYVVVSWFVDPFGVSCLPRLGYDSKKSAIQAGKQVLDKIKPLDLKVVRENINYCEKNKWNYQIYIGYDLDNFIEDQNFDLSGQLRQLEEH